MSRKNILNLRYPIVGLSPMDGVTDSAYRYITKKHGNPDVIFTEFTNVMGMSQAGQHVIKDFHYDKTQKPIVAQIYGKEPEYFYHVAKIACELDFDAVDINMGCPAKNVASSGSGAALIRTPNLAREIIVATKQGVVDWANDGKLTGLPEKTLAAVVDLKKELNAQYSTRKVLPVSVKTRIGYSEPVTEWWIKELEKENPAWISLHGRTLKQMYTGSADWDEIKKAVKTTEIPILANGDIKDYSDIKKVLDLTGAQGVLIGRASFGNPWIFKGKKFEDISLEERVKVMIEHTKKFVELNPDPKAFVQMRKHFGWYIKGFENASAIRVKLMQTNSVTDVEQVIQEAGIPLSF
ncbi:tRNA-dihydrouridine synthase [Candidatus Dojkabacteria bacterium]|nr:tRNA-dihydrouridine synthase [Candidatus Dojkabacteria bacterium]